MKTGDRTDWINDCKLHAQIACLTPFGWKVTVFVAW